MERPLMFRRPFPFKSSDRRPGLVGLDGFEPSTCSMPWKTYQSLAESSAVARELAGFIT